MFRRKTIRDVDHGGAEDLGQCSADPSHLHITARNKTASEDQDHKRTAGRWRVRGLEYLQLAVEAVSHWDFYEAFSNFWRWWA